MAKFCGKCGAKLDESNGICPNCGGGYRKVQEISSAILSDNIEKKQEELSKRSVYEDVSKEQGRKDSKNEKIANKSENKPTRITWYKVKKKIAKVGLFLLLILIIIMGTISILNYYGVFSNPRITTVMENLGIIDEPSIAKMCKDFSKNVQSISQNNDGTYTVEVIAPDFAKILKEETKSDSIAIIGIETMNTWIDKHPNLIKTLDYSQ